MTSFCLLQMFCLFPSSPLPYLFWSWVYHIVCRYYSSIDPSVVAFSSFTVVSGPTVTAEDHALRAALLAFHVGLFGDHRVILRRPRGGGELAVDTEYFLT